MKHLLYGLKASWRAELLKMKGSRVLLMTWIMGLFLPGLFNFISAIAKYYEVAYTVKEKLPYNIVQENVKFTLVVFGSFFFPLTLILITSRLAMLEHKSDTWKLVETQPVSRFSFWIVKWFMAALMSLLAIIVFFLSSIAFTYILFYLDAYDKSAFVKIPYAYVAAAGIRIWLSSLGIITMQLTISMLIRSTIWPIVIGVILLLLTNISTAMESSLATIWPYALPFSTSQHSEGSEVGNWLLPAEKQGLIWLLFIPFAFLLYRYRNSFLLSFRNKGLWSVALGGLIILSISTWWLQKPTLLSVTPGKTIIAGIIRAERLPDSVTLYLQTVGTEKAKVNKDGSFQFTLTMLSDVQALTLEIARGIPDKKIYAGNGDSVFVDWKQGKSVNLQSIKLSGTAIATHSFFENYQRPKQKLRFYLDYPEISTDPDIFYSRVITEWRNDIEKMQNYKTADGIGLSNTVREVYAKLITADYLATALYDYPEKRNINLQDIEFESIRKKLSPLQQKLKSFEEKLVGWNEYHDYLYLQITRGLPEGINQDSAYYAITMKRPPGAMRNLVLYDFARKKLQTSRDSISRALILKEMAVIDNPAMQIQLSEDAQLCNRLRRGQAAPFIALHDEKKQPVNLSMLKGKYVVIDVWATWCGPCLQQAPIFSSLSDKYKNSPITFLSISTDDDLSEWEQHIKRKKSRVLQWRIYDKNQLLKLYGINSIPHFILLDPNGNFLNASLPQPVEPNFEFILRQALNLQAEEG